MHPTEQYHVIVIGGGAAGLMCALTAGQRGRRVLVLEHADRVGKKILISGGGRCNFTNLSVDAANFLSANPHFCKSALNRYSPQDFIALVEQHGIPYHEKKLGQLFCDGKSTAIVNLLLAECRAGGVKIQTRCRVANIDKRVDVGGTRTFTLQSSLGTYEAESLVIATGGLSIPKMGATDFGYRVAKQFGLKVRPCRPGLVSLTLNTKDLKEIEGLSGTSADAVVSCRDQRFRDAMLFTHTGLSGPAILQISNYWEPGDPITINLLPECDLSDSIARWQTERPKAELKTLIGERLTRRLAEKWLAASGESKPVAQYGKKEIAAIGERVH
ncbi:MAG TPA: aminoacetone oxidase family FAD-binding enzyme, partial [Nitrospiria bacterium]|nr:aminoacetone oxidase family FAD-binding enzyme [Nitrospiria bacterium]